MSSGLVLLLLGGFLLGGVYSIGKSDPETGGRTAGQVVVAVVLLIAAVLATAAGVLRLV